MSGFEREVKEREKGEGRRGEGERESERERDGEVTDLLTFIISPHRVLLRE